MPKNLFSGLQNGDFSYIVLRVMRFTYTRGFICFSNWAGLSRVYIWHTRSSILTHIFVWGYLYPLMLLSEGPYSFLRLHTFDPSEWGEDGCPISHITAYEKLKK